MFDSLKLGKLIQNLTAAYTEVFMLSKQIRPNKRNLVAKTFDSQSVLIDLYLISDVTYMHC